MPRHSAGIGRGRTVGGPAFGVHPPGQLRITSTIIREYEADGSFHILSDRGEIELIDNAQDPYAADPISVVRLP
jgi:hypothetical protein